MSSCSVAENIVTSGSTFGKKKKVWTSSSHGIQEEDCSWLLALDAKSCRCFLLVELSIASSCIGAPSGNMATKKSRNQPRGVNFVKRIMRAKQICF